MMIIFLGLVALHLAALSVRTSYELLKDAGKVDPRSQALFSMILLDMIVLWASWFAACAMDPFRLVLPGIVHLAGIAILGVGIVLAVGALIQLRGVENIDHLVTEGFFRRIRHPMYLGFTLWILGWALFQGAVAGLALGLVGIANIFFWRRLEEQHLEAQYGETYRAYRARTWF
jgi:protein-S-isoprenylcysteine O-methyltransferase Ste14